MRIRRMRAAAAVIGCILPMVLSGVALGASWPKFYGQVGAYGVKMPEELGDMARQGFHFALLYERSAHSDAVAKNGFSYIDVEPQFEIYKRCHQELADRGSCSQSTQDDVLQAIQKHDSKYSGDPNLIGYWVLDDYPGGDVRDLMRKVHDEIASEHGPFARPAICGFNNMRALINFDPLACDMIAIYLYAHANRSDNSRPDWALSARLPEMLDALRAKGWDPRKTPLIGVPQAFGDRDGRNFELPDADGVAAQSEAFCRAGAVALLAYSWDDGGPRSQLGNTPSLVDGLKRGAQICRNNYWR